MPSKLRATFSSVGASALHGPHHSAQKSISTGRLFVITSASKLASVTLFKSLISHPYSLVRFHRTAGAGKARPCDGIRASCRES
ncbi:hypothetical protein [Burkholderia gladioli]|uniref:hypothetical protein n=1 Tax=Burkholderia gladioli TaxID=28095 RepID=UPI001FC7DA67|nr:hypothetical protein [Burkholderia gladioli]